jgi:transcriptional regulator with XRE-family HTH domain
MVDQTVLRGSVGSRGSRPRVLVGTVAEPERWVQTLRFFMARAGVTVEELAARSGVARLRVTRLMRGELPVTGEEAVALVPVLRCEPQDLMSGAPGPCVSGSAIFATHGMDGRSLAGVRPLSEAQWRKAWAELGIEDGIIPNKAD